MKKYCNECSKFIEPFTCKIYDVPKGAADCKNYDKKLSLFRRCKDCNDLNIDKNECSLGFNPKRDINKCQRLKENLQRERSSL